METFKVCFWQGSTGRKRGPSREEVPQLEIQDFELRLLRFLNGRFKKLD